MADQDESKGLRKAYSATSPTNAAAYQIQQELRKVFTGFLGFVKVCESKEETTGATYVTVLPAVMQIDGENNSLEGAELTKCPHYRIQQGKCALVIDPAPNDIGIFLAPKDDSTNIQAGVTEPQRPGSFTQFGQSNAVMVGTVLTQPPENWVTLRQDLTRESYAPNGVLNRTDKTIREEMGENHELQVGKNVTITVGKDVSITVSGNETINISGNFTGAINGNANLTVQGSCAIKAASITLDAPQTTVTGNMAVAGTLTAANGSMTAKGGQFTIDGAISATEDVTGGGISLTTHKHQGVHGETTAPLK